MEGSLLRWREPLSVAVIEYHDQKQPMGERESLFWLVVPLGEFIKGMAAGGLSRKPIISLIVNMKQRANWKNSQWKL